MTTEPTSEQIGEEPDFEISGGRTIEPTPPPVTPQFITLDALGNGDYDRVIGRTENEIIVWCEGTIERKASLHEFHGLVRWLSEPGNIGETYAAREAYSEGPFGVWTKEDEEYATLHLPCGDSTSFRIRKLRMLARALTQMKPAVLNGYGDNTVPPLTY